MVDDGTVRVAALLVADEAAPPAALDEVTVLTLATCGALINSNNKTAVINLALLRIDPLSMDVVVVVVVIVVILVVVIVGVVAFADVNVVVAVSVIVRFSVVVCG